MQPLINRNQQFLEGLGTATFRKQESYPFEYAEQNEFGQSMQENSLYETQNYNNQKTHKQLPLIKYSSNRLSTQTYETLQNNYNKVVNNRNKIFNIQAKKSSEDISSILPDNDKSQISLFSQNYQQNQQNSRLPNENISNTNSRYRMILQSTQNNLLDNEEEEFIDQQFLDATTNAQKDQTCIDPAADLSLVMYSNTLTKEGLIEYNKSEQRNKDSAEIEIEILEDQDSNSLNNSNQNKQMRTLSMFETGFKTFFPSKQNSQENIQNHQTDLNINTSSEDQQHHQRLRSDIELNNFYEIENANTNTIGVNQQSNKALQNTISRYFNQECGADDISEIYKSQIKQQKRQNSGDANQCDMMEIDEQSTSPIYPVFKIQTKRSNIQMNCLQPKVPTRLDDCSFEYSKAEDLPTHLMNESSFDYQLISDIEAQQQQQREEEKETERRGKVKEPKDQEFKQFQKVPRLKLDQISKNDLNDEQRKIKAKNVLKNMVLNSLAL